MGWSTPETEEELPPLGIFRRDELEDQIRRDARGLRSYRLSRRTRADERARRDIEILMRFERGETRNEIAAVLGVSYQLVQKVIADADAR